MDLTALRIGLVEDNDDNAELVRAGVVHLLGIPGYWRWRDGGAFLAWWDGRRDSGGAAPLDLLFLDLRLPDMSGLALLERLQADPAWPRLKAIALTAHVMPRDLLAARQAGFHGLLGKPIDTERFPIYVRQLARGDVLWIPY